MPYRSPMSHGVRYMQGQRARRTEVSYSLPLRGRLASSTLWGRIRHGRHFCCRRLLGGTLTGGWRTEFVLLLDNIWCMQCKLMPTNPTESKPSSKKRKKKRKERRKERSKNSHNPYPLPIPCRRTISTTPSNSSSHPNTTSLTIFSITKCKTVTQSCNGLGSAVQ